MEQKFVDMVQSFSFAACHNKFMIHDNVHYLHMEMLMKIQDVFPETQIFSNQEEPHAHQLLMKVAIKDWTNSNKHATFSKCI
jgi:hypothetical protein